MSCYMVTDYELSFLANYAAENSHITHSLDMFHGKTAQEIAKTLFEANADSVTHRYKGRMEVGKFTFDTRVEFGELSPLQLIKTAQHTNYQSCEVDGWGTSQQALILLRIISDASLKLPGYDDAAWGCPEPKIVKVM